ncbi:MAG: lysine--tRNA ligase [Acidobacteria bacterium]|nr:lysine--tRNA ligase [Acidobacteriota bacterium]
MFEPHDQYLQRKKKLEEVRKLQPDLYPHRFDFTHTVAEVVSRFSAADAEQLTAERARVRTSGRILALRLHGKTGFADLHGSGQRLQAYFRSDTLGDDGFALFQLFDLGDLIGVEGYLFRTKTGELTVHVERATLLAKALLPLPEKWHGLADVEQRHRQRYLDLLVNPGVRDVFLTRARIISWLREFLRGRGFVEVETPMMQLVAGGAAARPFRTHHNALDLDLFLRIAPELYLKRLVVGGLDRVFEINRNFRNEGISSQHNPEFTMLEFYQAYADYRDLMALSEEMLTGLAIHITGGTRVTFQEHAVDFARWQRLTLREAVCQYWPAGDKPTPEEFDLSHRERVATRVRQYNAWAERAGATPLTTSVTSEPGVLLAHLFEAVTDGKLIQPTLVSEFPAAVSPLAKTCDAEPAWAERFEVFAGGLELGNGYSEINDPEEQHQRFLEQARLRAAGVEEAQAVDEDYVRALAYGMPPAAGEGIGIDRLTMLLTNSRSIREVILFPLLRPVRPPSEEAAPGGEENTS